MPELSDEQVLKMAKARVSFKVHLFTYLVVNLFLMGIWAASGGMDAMHDGTATFSDYWPVWTHLGWGIGLAFHGYGAYGPGPNMVEREAEKIRRQAGKP